MKLKSILITATAQAFGITHLALQTGADVTAHAEAKLLSRHTEYSYQEYKSRRVDQTRSDQAEIKALIERNKQKLMAMTAKAH